MVGVQEESAKMAGAAWSAALIALAAALCGWVLFPALLIGGGAGGAEVTAFDQRGYGVEDVASQLFIAIIASAPILLAMRWRRDSAASVGLLRGNLGRSLLMGTALSLVAVGWRIAVDLRGQPLPGLESLHLWAFLQFAIVGFSEEFAFRGYLQPRLVTWLGRWAGWMSASLLMAFAHIVHHLAAGLSLPDAFAACASLVPISMLLGYIMLRTGNVAGPALFHTFVNWAGSLG